MTASITINYLRRLFSTHGLPESLVTDNASTFKSAEFQTFLKRNQIHHSAVPPWHPSSNGQAERMVQTTKEFLTKVRGDIKTNVARFLLQEHITPGTTTGRSPAELLMGRRLR